MEVIRWCLDRSHGRCGCCKIKKYFSSHRKSNSDFPSSEANSAIFWTRSLCLQNFLISFWGWILQLYSLEIVINSMPNTKPNSYSLAGSSSLLFKIVNKFYILSNKAVKFSRHFRARSLNAIYTKARSKVTYRTNSVQLTVSQLLRIG